MDNHTTPPCPPEDLEDWQREEVEAVLGFTLTREQVLHGLRELYNDGNYDHEGAHGAAERLLLRFINDREIAEAFYRFEFWYA